MIMMEYHSTSKICCDREKNKKKSGDEERADAKLDLNSTT